MSARWTALMALGAAACAKDFRAPGTLPGEAQGAGFVAVGPVTSSTVDAAGSASERSGVLSTARYSTGVALGMTRFGTMTGLDVSFGLGWLSGEAAAPDAATEAKNLYLDLEAGGTITPIMWRLGAVNLRATFDFGAGTTLDDGYLYTGGRVGFGAHSRRWALDLAARRRFGNTPGNPDAHEDRATAFFTQRRNAGYRTWHLGVELVRGDQRSLDATGVELTAPDYRLRGRYDVAMLVIGYGVAEPPDKVRLNGSW